jgi:hypothetical protein
MKMTKVEKKKIVLERKKADKIRTIERKNIRSNYSKNGGRF